MRLLVCSAAALFVMASVACGSKSSDEDATTDDAVTSIPRTDPAPGPAANQPASAPPPSDAPPPPATDAGSAEGGSGGGDGAAAVPNAMCAATSVVETEGNDSEATANALPNATSSFCGTLSSATDEDFVSFVLPTDTKNIGFGAAYSLQGVQIEGSAGGQAFNIGGTPAFKLGQKYVFRIHTTGDGPVSYRFDVTIGK